MFYNFVCLFIVFYYCALVYSLSDSESKSRYETEDFLMSSKKATPLTEYEIRKSLQWRHFLDGEHALQNSIRIRRGIVLIDEDFDVPPEPGVKQGWSDGDFDKKEIKTEVGIDKEEFTDEGSGIEIYTVTYSESISSEGTTKSIKQNASTDELGKTTEGIKQHTSPDRLEKTPKEVKSTSPMEVTDIEGSGDITEHISSSTKIPTEPTGTTLPITCLNFTCDSELLILPSYSEKVPVGTNLSLTCVLANSTKSGILEWYKHDEKDHLRIQGREQKEGLIIDISKSQTQHSGTYMCIHSTGQYCCHRQLDVTIYEVPNYKTHLIIIAVVAAVCLFTCILLAICRNFRVKKYEVQLELQNMEAPFIYKN